MYLQGQCQLVRSNHRVVRNDLNSPRAELLLPYDPQFLRITESSSRPRWDTAFKPYWLPLGHANELQIGRDRDEVSVCRYTELTDLFVEVKIDVVHRPDCVGGAHRTARELDGRGPGFACGLTLGPMMASAFTTSVPDGLVIRSVSEL
jgi:hypothetical protein